MKWAVAVFLALVAVHAQTVRPWLGLSRVSVVPPASAMGESVFLQFTARNLGKQSEWVVKSKVPLTSPTTLTTPFPRIEYRNYSIFEMKLLEGSSADSASVLARWDISGVIKNAAAKNSSVVFVSESLIDADNKGHSLSVNILFFYHEEETSLGVDQMQVLIHLVIGFCSALAVQFAIGLIVAVLDRLLFGSRRSKSSSELTCDMLFNAYFCSFGGLSMFIVTFSMGIFYTVTLIGIPIGVKLLTISPAYLLPASWEFERHSEDQGVSIALNICYFIFGGWVLILLQIFISIVMLVLLLGIPAAIQHIKLLPILFAPFGGSLKIKDQGFATSSLV